MSGDRFETLIAEGVDRIALPPESSWLPDRSRAQRRGVRLAALVFGPLAAAVIVLAALIGSGLRAARTVPATQPLATPVPVVVPSAMPSAMPSATPQISRTPDGGSTWQGLRRDLPAGVPIIEPTWMPLVFSSGGFETTAVLGPDPAKAGYTVRYHAGRDAVSFIVGPVVPLTPSSIGTSGVGGLTVRRSRAVLNFPTDLFTHPGGDGLRVVSWTEGAHAMRIESETISGDDLLRIAWSLDQAGAPGPLPPARSQPGFCADAASAEATARHLIALLGSPEREALTDCFAAETAGYAAAWTSLPVATLESLRPIEGAGGRSQLQVSWAFTAEPGGAWSPRPTNFFLIGREDGLWRVFAVNTAPFPKAP